MSDLLAFARRRRGYLIALLYVVAGFAVVLALVASTGGDLGMALSGWFTGAFGDGYNLTQTLADATPLALVAIGVSVALRADVITIGAEGQAIVGAVFSTALALLLGPSASPVVALPLGALAGVVGGVLWALPAAVAKLRWGVTEILFTLLANYLAVSLLTYLLRTVLRDPATNASPQSPPLPVPSQLPMLPVAGRIHIGIVLVAVLLVALWWWSRTRQAFVLDVYGSRPLLAARLGLTPRRAVLTAMIVSGATAGLAGWMQVAGVTQRLEPDVSSGIGFAGLAVAVLGRGNPIGIALAAVVYASLGTGAAGVQIVTGTVPTAIGTVTQGILLLTAALALAAVKITGRERADSVAAKAEVAA
ncbi:ABC transporter permease [Leifsonia sp. 21MFCrub1.1]|uniref:ABC transporter permease n=1 Tax=Leifsonia sp. 21MFCrub1.1 TaxID=1798223 RepID=UPI000892A3BE|nr:ABC transporter permease [Leifsonia sp. 21MFCrub1.1]SEB08197.1 simple sugar transport system permease protein [Leifsonia sp. 21MFCrub1.1]